VSPRIAFDLIASTQDEAVRRVRDGSPEGLTILARRQHRGRGRLDHGWSSPLGGLYLSTVVKEPKFEPGLVPVGVGAGLSEALRDRYAVDTVLKWPNDLLVRGSSPTRKLAGILVDRVLSPTSGAMLVVGIGLNVSTDRSEFPADLRERVAVLSELSGRAVVPDEVEPIVLGVVEETAARLATPEGRTGLWQHCRSALYGVGRSVRVDGRPAGVIRDLGEDGSLVVERDGALEAVRSGEVTVEGLA
jgi:BirA family biotin operon repressor/biotin-[acetyl-CoA-carboxylase] ligase